MCVWGGGILTFSDDEFGFDNRIRAETNSQRALSIMKCQEPERFNIVALLSSIMFLGARAVCNIDAEIMATRDFH